MEKAEEIISEFFGMKIPRENRVVSSVLKNWNSIVVDKRLADHCRLEDLSSSRMTVSFDHQGWIQIFKMHQKQILRNLEKYIPDAKVVSVRMIMKADVQKYKDLHQSGPDKNEKSNEETQEFLPSGNLKDIQDEELKERLENLKKKLQGN